MTTIDGDATWNEIDEVIAKYTTVDMAAALIAYRKDAERYRWLKERYYDKCLAEEFGSMAGLLDALLDKERASAVYRRDQDA